MILKILRNVAALLTGQVVVKLFSLFCIILLARRFGVEGFGMYGTVMAFLTLFAAFADSGLNTVTIRDVARDYAQSDTYFSHVLILQSGRILAKGRKKNILTSKILSHAFGVNVKVVMNNGRFWSQIISNTHTYHEGGNKGEGS